MLTVTETRRGEFVISTDKARIDVGLVHGFLTESYWAAGIPEETVRRSIEHSLAFGLFHAPDGQDAASQVGFARVISDCSTFAYVADVFVLPAYRGRGLGLWLMEVIMAHEELQGLRRWLLVTRDAHGLYRRVGFQAVRRPGAIMERHEPAIYRAGVVTEDLNP